jgi:putative chitinase
MDAKTFQLAAGVSAPRAAQLVTVMSSAMAEFDISTVARQAAFIAQCGHESRGYSLTREIWGPTPDQIGYEGRADLGNLQRGDGSTYRGRGFIQLTGRTNYLRAGKAFGIDLIKNPQLLEADDLAARVSGLFWSWRDLNALADAGDFLGISVRINGRNKKTGLPNGWDDRQARWAKAKSALAA